MRIVILITMLALSSCGSVKLFQKYGNAGKLGDEDVSAKAVYCLRDMLIGEDANGYWQVLIQPVGENLAPLLTGDNPCIEWSNKACGQYQLRYIVGSPCCRDTAVVNPLKCCLTGISICSE
jgi:hypothetical protein